jgi:hypothetical protein
MGWFWTWGGNCFGFREGDALYTYLGLQIGQFHGDEIYASDGRYLGEIMSGDRLITDRSKKNWRQSSFSPTRCSGYARYASYSGYPMYAGYEDFPSPDEFK